MAAKIPVGLQLYTLREEMKEDFVGVLGKVAEMGYQAVEFAGYGGIGAKEMKKHLDGLGLKALSSHVGLPLLRNELNQQIEYCLEIGAKYLVCPSSPKDKITDPVFLDQLIAEFRVFGEACRKQGLVFAFHNHAHEFQQMDGQPILDRMYAGVDSSLLQAELDLYWVKKGGAEPRDYMLKYKGRCPLVHVKDMADDADGSFAEVGHGIIDFSGIFAVAEEVGVQGYIVEQDRCYNHPPLTSVKMSIDYLKSIGLV
jgi:sugar phosphate isomerase/epimerase